MKAIITAAAIALSGCQFIAPQPQPAPVEEVRPLTRADHDAVAPEPAPTPTPQPQPWQLAPGWTRILSEEGKEIAYIPRDTIACRDSWSDYCFEFKVMAREGCPTALYVEFQLTDPNTNAVIGMGNDRIPSLMPGQVGLLSINTPGPSKIGGDTVKCY